MKRTPLKRSRKPLRRHSKNRMPRLKKALNDLWAIAIKILGGHKCAVCGSTELISAHHCIVKAGKGLAVRWNFSNGICLCRNCHIYKVHGGQCNKSWMDNYFKILNERIPLNIQQEIEQKAIAGSGKQIPIFELEEIQESLQLWISNALDGKE